MEQARIADLRPDEANPRRINAHEAEALKRSLEEYGAVEPAVVNQDGTIIGGHMRLEAAKELGWETFPVVRVDLPHEKAALLNLALNRISGEWDEDKLAELLAELEHEGADLALSGFDTSERFRNRRPSERLAASPARSWASRTRLAWFLRRRSVRHTRRCAQVRALDRSPSMSGAWSSSIQ